MAHRNASDSRHVISPAAHPPPISTDNQGSENSIPLSPQWWVTKMGESKHDSGNEDEHSGSLLKNDKHLDILKSSKSSEVVDPPRRKDIFRPSLLDQDTGRHERWREEERDTNPAVRREHWREGDKELAENRKIDRWTDKSASKHYGENQRVASDRWGGSGNKDSGYERRESKWTNRWGPNDKDKEVSEEKPHDLGMVSDSAYDRSLPTQTTHRKDDREADVYRPWRGNSATQGRGRGDPPNSQTLTPSKNFAFSYGRGRSENQPPAQGHTHGRPNMSTSQPSGLVFEEEESIHIKSSISSYSRARLIDVYRTMDKRTSWKLLDGFIEVPSLTQDELADPLGISAPSPEEEVILMGINKGEVLSSGVPVNNKEKPAEQHPSEFSQSRRPKTGSKEDLPHMMDGILNDNVDKADVLNKQARHYSAHHSYNNAMPTPAESSVPFRKSGELSGSRDLGVKRDTYVPPGSSWRSPSVVEHAHLSPSEKYVLDDRQSSNRDFVRSQQLKNLSDDQEKGSIYKLHHNNEPKWQAAGRRVTETPSLTSLHQGNESKKLSHTSPEDLILFYKDPQGNIQGPFSGSDIIGWYDAGYFGIDLQVRSASASEDQPFSLLGDVMPHLRSKARPPPGFNAPKQGDPLDVTSMLSHSNSGKLLGNSSEMDSLKNDVRPIHGFSTDADNRFLESLMAGPQGIFGNNSSSVLPVGVDNANLYLLAKKMALEHQQRSSAGRDPTPLIPKPEIGPDNASVHPKLQTPLINNSHITPQSQNSELLAMLQGVSERPSGVSSAVSAWSKFPVQGGQNIHQSSPISVQHQILQAQNNPLLLNLLSQPQSTALKPESVPAIPQDPQTLNLLQQQYLMNLHSQHSQAPAPLQQLSILDKLLLLQQQQSEQQQLQLLRQHNMLPQTFADILPHQHPAGPSYLQTQANLVPVGGVDQLQHQLAQLQFNASIHRPPSVQDENSSEQQRVHPQVLQDVSMGSLTSQEISTLSSQIPHEIIQSNLKESQDVLKLDPRITLEVKKSAKASMQLSRQPSEDATNIGEDFSEYLSEVKSRSESIISEFGDGYKSLDNKDPLSLESLESRKSSIQSSESVKLHDKSKVICSGIDNHNDIEPSLEKDVKITETHDSKKGSDKKSKKQKASKASEQRRGVSNITLPQHKNVSEGDLLASGDDVPRSVNKSELEKGPYDKTQQTLTGYADVLKDSDESLVVRFDQKADEGQQSQKAQPHRAWKPAPGFKPKSLLEIQQEEQKKLQPEAQTVAVALSANSVSLPTPWAGVVANTDTKTYMDVGSIESVSERALKHKSSKSELHDLLTDKVNNKLNDVELQRDNQKLTVPEPLSLDDSEPTDDFDFIQAKDTKKSRKKSGKTKGGSSKMISVTPDISLGSSPIEKIKSSRQVHQEMETLPSVPSGPSLGDFVVWKGESASISSSYAPAWSTDSGKVQPILLRDILKEQEKKTTSHATLQKPQSAQSAHGVVSSRAPAAPSLSKSHIATQVNSISTQSKYSVDDDLFWGPIDSSKQEAKQSDFPKLASHSSPVPKSSTPLKGNVGGQTKQKSVPSKTADYSQSYFPDTNIKGRNDSKSKQAEAMDFRDWCQTESVRLIGTKDTSFLEFCLKQTRSEAEILLVENLGSYDPKHEFIDKFLNYKELLPADVLEIAFGSQNDQKSNSGQGSLNTSTVVGSIPELSVKGGSKKKSKKGKKVSPSVLGFNVVSNRIMMGEIQTVED